MNAPMVRTSIYTDSTRNKGKSRQESRGTATATDRLQASNTCSKAIGGGSEPPSVWKHAAADRCVGGTGGLEPGGLRTKTRRSDSVVDVFGRFLDLPRLIVPALQDIGGQRPLVHPLQRLGHLIGALHPGIRPAVEMARKNLFRDVCHARERDFHLFQRGENCLPYPQREALPLRFQFLSGGLKLPRRGHGWAVQFHPQRARLLPELCRPRGPRLHELDIVSAGPAHELHRHADLFRPLVEMRELPYEQIQERVQILHRSLNLVRTKPHPREHLSLLRRGGLRRENGALKSHQPCGHLFEADARPVRRQVHRGKVCVVSPVFCAASPTAIAYSSNLFAASTPNAATATPSAPTTDVIPINAPFTVSISPSTLSDHSSNCAPSASRSVPSNWRKRAMFASASSLL